jgi:hypothetical protein
VGSAGRGVVLLLLSAGGAFFSATGGGGRTSRRALTALVGPRAGITREATSGAGTGFPGKAARSVGFTAGWGTIGARARRPGGTRTT